MNQHWSIELWLAKERQAELRREAQQAALGRALSASGQPLGWIARLLAAWRRQDEAARAGKPAMSE